MPKLILLPVTGTATDAPAYAIALAAARLFRGHLNVLHVRPDVQREIASLAGADMGMAGGLDATLDRLEQDAEAREHAADAAWRDFCGRHGVETADRPPHASRTSPKGVVVSDGDLARTGSSNGVSGTGSGVSGPGDGSGVTTQFLVETGIEPDWVAAHGRVADLIVTSRGRADDAASLDVIEAALLNTGRPVLIAPETVPDAGWTLDGTVGIAWKDCKEAAGAVAAALPFINRARRVLIFVVDEGGDRSDHSPARLAHALRWHNDDVAVKVLHKGSEPPAVVLMQAALEIGCGLLVMGGYGHGRLREAVFGGFTRAVLDDAQMPVLIAH